METEIDPAAPEPVYEQIAGWIRRRIEDGTFGPRQKIPSSRSLSQRFGVAEVTARKAVRLLAREGLVYTVNGKGTFVAGKKGD